MAAGAACVRFDARRSNVLSLPVGAGDAASAEKAIGKKKGFVVGLQPKKGEVLFEFRKIGNSVKVSAIDPQTNTEISIVGPATAGEYALKMAAIRKLQYVLGRGEKG